VRAAAADLFDEERHNTEGPVNDPETLLIQADVSSAIERAIGGLPDRSRQLLVLREVEGLSYRELADAMDIPIGTVMSGLSRARQAFRTALSNHLEPHGGRPATHRREEADAVLA
jgi:RNA polymerase sigma factor (sigma-70 family)